MWTREYWLAVVERAISTVAQAMLAVIGVEIVAINMIDWGYVLGIGATAGVLSVLKGLIAGRVGSPGPSFGPETLKGL